MTISALRESQAALALIRRPSRQSCAYLCQWSDTWQALHFIGGHREPEESFRECAVREIVEELGLAADEFTVPPKPTAQLEYQAFSESVGVPTRYVLAVFETMLTTDAARRVGAAAENAWVVPADIRCGKTPEGLRISPSVALILNKLKLQLPE